MAWKTYAAHGLKLSWSLILKIVRVGNLPWGPDPFVDWVVNVLWGPFAFVRRVLLGWWFPFAATGDFITFGVWHLRRHPVAIFLIIPVLGLLGLGIWDHGGLVLKPIFRPCGFLVYDLEGSVFVPILRLCRLGVGNSGLINPVFWLGILGIVDLSLWVH